MQRIRGRNDKGDHLWPLSACLATLSTLDIDNTFMDIWLRVRYTESRRHRFAKHYGDEGLGHPAHKLALYEMLNRRKAAVYAHSLVASLLPRAQRRHLPGRSSVSRIY